MKKWMFALICVLGLQNAAWADTDRPIEVSQLPAKAQQIITKYFSGKKVALAKQETGILDRSYDVVFTNGDKIEFDRSGNWVEVKSKTAVPQALVPASIVQYLKSHYPESFVTKIELDRKEYEVDLSIGWEIKFNSKFQVIDIDD